MPLAIGSGGVVVAPTPSSPVVLSPRAPKPADLPSASWIDPTGVVWPLTDLGARYFTTQGTAGLGAVPLTLTTDPQDGGGVSVRTTYPGPRLITWPLYIEGTSHADFLTRWRAIARAFTCTTRKGPGTLVIARPDGTARQIQAVYQDGYDGDPEMGVRYDVVALTLLCPDPYWQATAPVALTRAYAGAAASFLSPFPNVSNSQTLGATKAVNPGDVEAWPSWTITGPASSITFANNTRGESWTLDPVGYRGTALAAGETVTVTTRPPAVTGPDGSSWYGALNSPAAVLWRLDDGISDITFTVAGSGPGTSVSASFVPRFETA